MEKKKLRVLIDGCVYASNENESVDLDEFWEKFIHFVEDNEWHFGGATKQIDWEGNDVRLRISLREGTDNMSKSEEEQE